VGDLPSLQVSSFLILGLAPVRPLVLVLLTLLLGAPAGAQSLPLVVREAVALELEGKLGEALGRYRAALTSVPSLVQDETMSQALTVRVFSKAAHLSLDLGLGEEAWDLAGRMLSAKNQRAVEAGTLVRMRLLRVQERWAEALELFDQYSQAWPLPPPGPGLLTEVRRVRVSAQKSGAAVEALLRKAGGPASWALQGTLDLLPSPTEAWDLSVTETVRLQVGAFKDWGNALTLIDMLREKGWAPFTDVRSSGGEKLYLVYVLSRQPASDRSRLEAQGLTALP
jgi:hypothetical protein